MCAHVSTDRRILLSGITPDAVLEAGHTEQVRTFQWMGQAIATGGEDAKICSWREPSSLPLSAGGNGANGGEGDDDVAMDEGR